MTSAYGIETSGKLVKACMSGWSLSTPDPVCMSLKVSSVALGTGDIATYLHREAALEAKRHRRAAQGRGEGSNAIPGNDRIESEAFGDMSARHQSEIGDAAFAYLRVLPSPLMLYRFPQKPPPPGFSFGTNAVGMTMLETHRVLSWLMPAWKCITLCLRSSLSLGRSSEYQS